MCVYLRGGYYGVIGTSSYLSKAAGIVLVAHPRHMQQEDEGCSWAACCDVAYSWQQQQQWAAFIHSLFIFFYYLSFDSV